jgi:hypothetical protein
VFLISLLHIYYRFLVNKQYSKNMKSKIAILLIVIFTSLFAAYLTDGEKSKGQKFENLPSLTPTPKALLPDLKILPADELYIVGSSGSKTLRFSSSFINQGEGVFEISGKEDVENESTIALQRISNTDGSITEREIGKFVFHPDHEHWHIADYTVFELWKYNENGDRSELITSTNKISFCIWDENPYDLTLKGAPQVGKYPRCDDTNSEPQGISIGWSDTYSAGTPGQELDIADVPDGDYLIRSVINPDRKILESNYENNEYTDYVNIKGNNVSRISI